MAISSRTPEGQPNRCPVCKHEVRIESSAPAGDASCPHCGVLLWFVEHEEGYWLFDKRRLRMTGEPGLGTGEKVRITDGTFESFEGVLETLDEQCRIATIVIDIFGRKTPVEVPLDSIQSA